MEGKGCLGGCFIVLQNFLLLKFYDVIYFQSVRRINGNEIEKSSLSYLSKVVFRLVFTKVQVSDVFIIV